MPKFNVGDFKGEKVTPRGKKVIFYTQQEYDAALNNELIEELNDIMQWMKDTDYMVFKVIRGNWEETDVRYITYLAEYEVKHARKEEIENILKG